MTSNYTYPSSTPKFRIRDIRPVSRHFPCYIDLRAHPYHIYNSSVFLAAYSSLRCAEHSIELGLILGCPADERYQLVQDLRILDVMSGLEYRRMGTTWEPV